MANRIGLWGKYLWLMAGVWAAGCVYPSIEAVDEPAKTGKGGSPGEGGSTAVTEQGGTTAVTEQGGTTAVTLGGATSNGGTTPSSGGSSKGGTTANGGVAGSAGSAGSAAKGGASAGTAGRFGSGGTSANAGNAGRMGIAGAAGSNGFVVRPNGYVTSGGWHGWPWAAGYPAATTISTTSPASNLVNGRLCISGKVATLGDAKLGIAINQTESGAAGTVVPTSSGLVVNVENRTTSAIQICLYRNDSSAYWCAPLPKYSTDVFIPWEAFGTLSGTSGTDLRYAKQPITGVMLRVVATDTPVDYDFCLNNLADGTTSSSGAGGASGVGGASGIAGTAGRAGGFSSAGSAGTLGTAGSAGAAGAKAALRRWEFGSSIAGAAGAMAIDGWALDPTTLTNGAATDVPVNDPLAADGHAVQLNVSKLVSVPDSTTSIHPRFVIDINASESQTLNAQGRTVYARWRLVSPNDPSTLGNDTVRLWALSSYWNTATSTIEGWMWVNSDATPLAAVPDHDWHVTFWPLPAKVIGTPATNYWDPAQLAQIGIIFEAWGAASGVVPFTFEVDSVWIE